MGILLCYSIIKLIGPEVKHLKLFLEGQVIVMNEGLTESIIKLNAFQTAFCCLSSDSSVKSFCMWL